MSDTTTMPFQPGTMAEPPPPPEVDEPGGNQRLLLILGALAGLAVLGIAAYFLLFSGGGDDTAASGVVPAAQTTAQPSTAPSATATTAAVPKISKRNFGTDPFKALIADTTATGAGAGTTTGSTTGTTAAPATGSTTGTTAAPATGTTTGTTAGTTTGSPATDPTTPVASKSYHFRVVSVGAGNSTVNVKVNGKSFNGLKAGQLFAKIFKVRFIGGNVNAFQIGDEVFNVSGAKSVHISS